MGQHTFRLALVAIAALTLLSCGDEKTEPVGGSPVEPAAEDPQSPSERADAYAVELAGQRTGCTQEIEAGCNYSAAFAGCYEAITGKQLGPIPFEEEFPEPKYRAVHAQAIEDCS